MPDAGCACLWLLVSFVISASPALAQSANLSAGKIDTVDPLLPGCWLISRSSIGWYQGGLDESCQEVCDEFGGFDEATVTWAGAPAADDRSNAANCEEVVVAMGAFAFEDSVDNLNLPDEVGCAEDPAKSRSMLVSRGATTASGTNPFARRFCACNE